MVQLQNNPSNSRPDLILADLQWLRKQLPDHGGDLPLPWEGFTEWQHCMDTATTHWGTALHKTVPN
eukprot:7449812-Lingulodinium_polyedra.AAC.1